MLAIECRNLVKTYDGKPPVEAVRGLDLAVEQGECFGLLGPNGAGKTTTIEIIEGLLDATSGEVEVLGYRWGRQDDEIRQRIGISLQETRLSEKLSVRETLTLFRSFYRQGIEPEQAMARVSLEEKAKSWVKNLSGGQKQRLAVACALVGDPELLFLDEPTTGLDPQSRRQLWEIIRQFREAGRTVLFTTHYMDEAERLCDRVAIVDHGKVIALGTPRGVDRQPRRRPCDRIHSGIAQRGQAADGRRVCRSPGRQQCPLGKRPHLPFGPRAARCAAGDVGAAGASRLAADRANHAQRQLGRCVCETRRAAFERRTDATTAT